MTSPRINRNYVTTGWDVPVTPDVLDQTITDLDIQSAAHHVETDFTTPVQAETVATTVVNSVVVSLLTWFAPTNLQMLEEIPRIEITDAAPAITLPEDPPIGLQVVLINCSGSGRSIYGHGTDVIGNDGSATSPVTLPDAKTWVLIANGYGNWRVISQSGF